MKINDIHTYGRQELACLYFPHLQPRSAWQKLRQLLQDDPRLAHLATLPRRCFLPSETELLFEALGRP